MMSRTRGRNLRGNEWHGEAIDERTFKLNSFLFSENILVYSEEGVSPDQGGMGGEGVTGGVCH